MAEKQKLFVLDTNVLVHDPQSIFQFGNNIIGIPIMVLEELDQFKSEASERGFSSREVIRNLDALRSKGSLQDGVQLDNGGSLQVLFIPMKEEACAWALPADIVDNQILYTAFCKKQKGYDVSFVSKDINARVKSDAIGIPATDYVRDNVSQDDLYYGWITISVPAIQLKKDFPDDLLALPQQRDLAPNEYVVVESKHNPFNYLLFRYLGQGKFKAVHTPQLKWPLDARNPQQLMALDALFDPEIQLVTLIGPAGTGKTFLALLAALHQTLIAHEYEKILITRPVIPLGPDIGYLPGDVHEKLQSWMQPIYDNMDFIAHSINLASQMAIYKDEGSFKGKGKKKPNKEHEIASLDDLIKDGKVSLEAITYMRGRSIPYQFIFIDEVQNLTPHEVKTLISRVGEGSKIVLAGDPYQIDSPYLDLSSNGLVVATTKFKGQSIFAAVYLESSERSELSKLASELM